MTTIKLTIEYDGTVYAGWQQQPDLPTIQGQLELALFQITQEKIPIIGAGRTDAGVHALGQVASFRTSKFLPPHKWAFALNRYLPHDIAVLRSEREADSFHARYSAKTKIYEYKIRLHPCRPALDRHRVWTIPFPLDLSRIEQALPLLTGRHDFTSFEGPRASTKDPFCTISSLSSTFRGDLLTVRLEADRFLKQMVRALVGTLVEIGRHRREPEDLPRIIQARDRRAAGETAPPQGLYLVEVCY